MPQLLNGKWVNDDVAANEMRNGAFHREETRFREWLTPDGANGPDGAKALTAEAGRFQLFVAYICPWASRTLMMRKLKGLDKLISVSVAEPELGEDGWTFAQPADAGETLPPVKYMYQLYTKSDPTYSGKVSVPVLWDRIDGRIINNESADIIRIFNTAFDHITGDQQDFYPPRLRQLIDKWNAAIYEKLNNGVYRAGFARAQSAYDAAVSDVFETLDRLETHLSDNRFIAGPWLTEADIRLFVTLIRFDAAYHGAFKCNFRRLTDYPALSGYLREIYQWPGIAETVNIEHIKRGYYSVARINPDGIVPIGPELILDMPHGRDGLPGEGVPARTGQAA